MRTQYKLKLVVAAGMSCLLSLSAIPNVHAEARIHSEPSAIASKNLLLDIAQSGKSLVAVGERGHVLRSADCGLTWKQVIVPTRATLNGLFFIDDKSGWIVGHDSTILQTRDGGASWSEVYRDTEAEPLFDVLFITDKKGFAIGAYGTFMHSEDGGSSWKSGTIYGEDDFHLYSIAYSRDGELLVTGEAGSIYLSNNQGKEWHKISSPYEGTFFGQQLMRNGKILVYGMRGNLYSSDDLGQNWSKISLGLQTSLENSLITQDGDPVLTGASGVVLKSTDNGKSFKRLKQANNSHRMALIQCQDKLLSVGEKGVEQVIE